MSIKISGNAFSRSNSDAGYFETLFKKFDEKRAELQTAIDEYFAEAEKKKNELKDIADIATSAKDTAVRAKEYAYDSAKNCLSGANSAASSALKCENYVISAKKCAENIDGIYEIIKKIEHNVEELEGNAQAFANEAETYAKKCADLSDNALESAHKSEHYALKSELAFESARIAREKCEDILSDIKFYEKSVLDAEERIEKAITVKTISANGKKLEPDKGKNIDIPLARPAESADVPPVELADGEYIGKLTEDEGTDGLMSKDDKEKLDGIETGAEKNNFSHITVNGVKHTDGSFNIDGFDGEICYSGLDFSGIDGICSSGVYKVKRDYGIEDFLVLIVMHHGKEKEGVVWQTLVGANTHHTRYFSYDGFGGWSDWESITEDCAKKSELNSLSQKTVKYTDAQSVIGKFTVTPVISGVTAKFMFDLIYPFDYDGYKVFVKDAETSDGIIAKGKGFVTAPAIFDGSDVKVHFYSGKTAVFSATVKKLSEISHAKNGGIKYGVLCV